MICFGENDSSSSSDKSNIWRVCGYPINGWRVAGHIAKTGGADRSISGEYFMNVSISQLFAQARSHRNFQNRPISDSTLMELYEMLKWGPTSVNCCPARFKFVTSPEAKAKLLECLSPGNVEKTAEAPVTVLVGMDMMFYEKLPRLFPHYDSSSWFAGQPQKIESTALRNSSLQGAYLMLAARALGLDCGPMSGFNSAKVDEAFWSGTDVQTNFIVALGYGESSKLHPRGPRFAFDEVCQIE
jgi:nitroreductase